VYAEYSTVSRLPVYGDRAQVERTVKVTPQQCGVHDVLLTGLPPATDTDSIRVKGIEGACEVLDVAYDVHSRTKPYDAPDTSVLHGNSQHELSYTIPQWLLACSTAEVAREGGGVAVRMCS
jgi:hypothetical protein